MIDTIFLYSNDYKPDFEGDYERKIIEDEKGELKTEKYFRNTELYNLEFGIEKTHRGSLESSPLKIHFSIPKVLNNGVYNLDFNHSDIGEIRGFLNHTLKPFGVNTDKLKVGRVDIYKNIQVEPSYFIHMVGIFPHYHRYKKQSYFENGVYNLTYMNKSKELGLYDKTTELKHKYRIDLGYPVVRSELRLKKHKVCSDFGIDRFRDVEELVKEEKTLKVVYNTQVGKIVKKAKAKKGVISIMSIEDLDMKDINSLLVGGFLALIGEEEALNIMEAGLKKKLEKGLISRRTYFRWVDYYRRAIQEYRKMNEEIHKRSEKFKRIDEIYKLLFYEDVA